jgi:hypothetical protein
MPIHEYAFSWHVKMQRNRVLAAKVEDTHDSQKIYREGMKWENFYILDFGIGL